LIFAMRLMSERHFFRDNIYFFSPRIAAMSSKRSM
jgi:hypothetical protein